ncbi:MAG: DUF2934 domain-containing protein, partial [Acidobacteriota bacterium]
PNRRIKPVDEVTIKDVLCKDENIRRLISERAYEIFISGRNNNDKESDWYQAEREIVGNLVKKILETNRSWFGIVTPGSIAEKRVSFITLVGFMLAKGGLPSQGDLFNTQYYTIGLSYLTGMFQIGRTLDESTFLSQFANDNTIVQALLYCIRAIPKSPYYTASITEDLKVYVDNDEELERYMAYANKEIREFFGLVKAALLGEAAVSNA